MKLFYKSLNWSWILLILSMLVNCQQLQLSRQESGQNKTIEKELFDGKSMDGWKITDWEYGGEVKVNDRTLVLGKGHEGTGVTWQKDFPEMNYEVTLDAMRIEGSDFFCGMTFPVGEEFCTLIVGGWGGSLIGLSNIDGFDASENSTTTQRVFNNNQWYHIRLRVTEKKIEAWIDEDQVVDFSTKNHRLSLRLETIWSKPFGILTWRTKGALKDIRVRYPVKDELE